MALLSILIKCLNLSGLMANMFIFFVFFSLCFQIYLSFCLLMAVMKMLAGTFNFVMVIDNYRPGPYIMDIFYVRANCSGMGSGHFM